MRTTATLDDDLGRTLNEMARSNERSFKEVVNEAIRRRLSLGDRPDPEQPRKAVDSAQRRTTILKLPGAGGRGTKAGPGAFGTGVQPGRRRRVLLAEDDPINQRLAAAFLDKHGHAVVLAVNGHDPVF